MDLKNNKFLRNYVIVTGVAALALGYLLYSSFTAAGAAEATYTEAKGAVDRLEGKSLYPSEKNLSERTKAVAEYTKKVSELQTKLLGYQKPLNAAPDATKFQTNLQDLIKLTRAQAEANGTDAKDLDFGFAKYLSTLPADAAVADLEFQLDGIKNAVDLMLKNRVTKIDNVRRDALAIESGKAEPAADPATPAGKGAKPAPRAASGSSAKTPAKSAAGALTQDAVMKTYPFVLRFTGLPASVREVFNDLANTQPGTFFYAIRDIRVENEKKEGPQTGAAPVSSENTQGPKRDSRTVLGGEKVTAQLYVDLIRFIEPQVAAASTEKTPAAAGAK